ncbi:NADH dehydrogenase [ubiquinone] 1 alpha subcomplex subunit 9, mitochondrial-like [Rhopilema esculentum]|uniref:NADH dehydrogenase [ubiquinone] 1 alpha subcomplex subunit 9, mitochondrial-like n=1 Tax=Rhopilema esculentum TaxID=499914 RepID=UPI0031DAA399
MLAARARSLVRFDVYVPIISETAVQKRHASSQDFHPKRGPGGRSSFNGVVATVFGSTGFLGRYTVNRLARCGTQLIVPYRCMEDYLRHLKPMGDIGQIMFNNFHLKDVPSIEKCVQFSNVVVNLIGKEFETKNFSFHDAHVEGAAAIAKAAKNAGVKRFIHVSALNAATNSPSKFLQTKAQGERAVKQEFPEATILRPAECYGHEDKFLNMYAYLRNLPFGQPLIDNGMETKKRPVLVADVAQAIVNAALDESAAGKTYELYGPEEYYLHDIVEYVYKIIRKPFRPYKIPENIYKMVAYFLEQSIFDPRMTRDKVTRHYLSDQISSHIMSFEDLGIKPATINEAAISMLRRHRDMMHYDDSHTEDEFCKPTSAYN